MWGLYCLRSRAAWFFSASNPTIAFGGFEGESKSEIYVQMPQHLYPQTLVVPPQSNEEEWFATIEKMFSFPFVVKPDVGMKGILFRMIENKEQWQRYHRRMPATYLVQAYVPYPHEVSVFYCRMPQQQRGKITAIIQKNLLQVTGNGRDTLLELLQQQKDAESFLPQIKKQQGRRLHQVLQKGERVYLSLVGNRMNGATFTNLTHEADDALLQLFDGISRQTNFCYGRYDIKCNSVEAMKEGRDFLILEFNGAGSIPNHIYTPGVTLWQAYGEILRHWRALYQISKAHHKAGIPYWSFGKGYSFLQASKKHFNELKKIDDEMVLP